MTDVRSTNIPTSIYDIGEFLGHAVVGTTRSTARFPRGQVLGAIESRIATLESQNGVALVFNTRADLLANLAYAQHTMAMVRGDSTTAFNGIYERIDSSWTRVADLPEAMIRLTVTGGTANTIVATASPQLPAAPESKLYIMVPDATNTAAVTIIVDASTSRAINSGGGQPMTGGELRAGVPALLVRVGAEYRIQNDPNTYLPRDGSIPLTGNLDFNTHRLINLGSPTVATDAATKGYADSIAGTISGQIVFATKSAAAAYSASAPGFIRLEACLSAELGGGALYRAVSTQPTHQGKFQISHVSGQWYEIVIVDDQITAAMLGALRDGSDETATVQKCLDVIGARKNTGTGLPDHEIGGIVINNRGTKFNLANLVFPMRSNMRFYPDDNLHGAAYAPRGTNEMISYAANANVDGIVNEYRVEAGYGIGLIINTLSDIPGHDGFLGTTQQRVPSDTTSAKTFFVMEQQYATSFQIVTETFGGDTLSAYNGTGLVTCRRRQTLHMASTSALISTVGVQLRGLNAGTNALEAFGYIVSKTATTFIVDWAYGVFKVGQKLYDGAGGPYPVLTAVDGMDVTSNQPMYFGRETPAITIGVAAGSAKTDFTIAGRQMVVPNAANGAPSWHTKELTTNAALGFCNNLQLHSDVGQQFVLNNGGRLVLVNNTNNGDGSDAIGELNFGVRCNFSNSASAGVPADSFNASHVDRLGTGTYKVWFTNLLPYSNYSPTLELDNIGDEVRAVTRTTSYMVVQNYNRTTGAAADLAGNVFVKIFG
jgi:hypothetical protein